VENGMEAPPKTKYRSVVWSSNTTPRDILKEGDSIAALVTIAKLW
jgi:hypothetical protein